MTNSVGQNIKRLRKEKSLTQEEMAKKLGISRSYLANLEAGRKNVGEATIKSMSEKSGISMYYLTTGTKLMSDLPESEQPENIFKGDNKKFTKERLLRLAEADLSPNQADFINSSLSFLNVVNEVDLPIFIEMFRLYTYFEDAYILDDEDPEGYIDSVEEIKQRIEEVFNLRFGITKHDKGD